MKQILRSALGVTLLEIMLVLAVAAMIIVMSVRYYQSATANQQTNSAIEQLQAISAAADQLAQANGSYSDLSNIATLLPANGLTAPWGSTIAVTTAGQTSYTVAFPAVPAQICQLFTAKVLNNNHYSISGGSCGTTAQQITFTYNASP